MTTAAFENAADAPSNHPAAQPPQAARHAEITPPRASSQIAAISRKVRNPRSFLPDKTLLLAVARRVAAGSAGAGAGAVLRGVGINVNLAPVLDVYRQPGNFIDEFQRSYSSNPKSVAELGAAFISARQRLGVAATDSPA